MTAPDVVVVGAGLAGLCCARRLMQCDIPTRVVEAADLRLLAAGRASAPPTYRVRAVTVGTDAQGEAHVEAEHDGRRLHARAVSTDIVEASALAYLDIINRMVAREARPRLTPYDAVPTEEVPGGE